MERRLTGQSEILALRTINRWRWQHGYAIHEPVRACEGRRFRRGAIDSHGIRPGCPRPGILLRVGQRRGAGGRRCRELVRIPRRGGEHATYDVELKGHRVGRGSFDVIGADSVDGRNTMHASLKVTGGLLFAKVDDQFDSWFDPHRFTSRRFVQNQREVGHTRRRHYEIAPEQGTFVEKHSGRVDSLSTDEPLDDVSFLFYVRTLPLRVGDVDTIPRYFKSGRDVIIRVIGKRTITVPAGTFETIVVQPTITNASGLFGQGGNAEVYFTDDSARTLVMLKSHVPVLGSLALTLREMTPAK